MATTSGERSTIAGKMKLDVDALSGEEVQAEVAKAYAMPPHIIERARQAQVYKPR